MPALSTKLQLAHLKNLYYWTSISKVLEEPFTFTWKHKIAEFSPCRKHQRIATWWPTINDDRRPRLWWIHDRNQKRWSLLLSAHRNGRREWKVVIIPFPNQD